MAKWLHQTTFDICSFPISVIYIVFCRLSILRNHVTVFETYGQLAIVLVMSGCLRRMQSGGEGGGENGRMIKFHWLTYLQCTGVWKTFVEIEEDPYRLGEFLHSRFFFIVLEGFLQSCYREI